MYIVINKKKITIEVCNNFRSRLMGMMFQSQRLSYGLCFKKCNCIHTFFMKQNIDIIMTDKNNKVLYIKKNLKPWKIIWPKKNVHCTYEFSNNLIKNINIGDYIYIKKQH